MWEVKNNSVKFRKGANRSHLQYLLKTIASTTAVEQSSDDLKAHAPRTSREYSKAQSSQRPRKKRYRR